MTLCAMTVVVGVMLGLTLALTSPLQALSVGNMSVRSFFGRPFLAEIPLQLTPQERAQGVTVLLGDLHEYRAEKLPRHAVIETLDAVVTPGPREMIRVVSRIPVDTAAFALVLLVRTGQVTIVKPFQVMLSPAPAVTPNVAAATPEGPRAAAPRTRTEKASPPVGQPPATKKAATPEPKPTLTWAQRLPTRYGPIQNGATLYGIAEDLGVPKDGLWQAVILLWEANKMEFFGENMHGLRAGSSLAIPGGMAEGIAAMSRGEAQRLIAEQWDAWQALRRNGSAVAQVSPADKAAGLLKKPPPLPDVMPLVNKEVSPPTPTVALASANQAGPGAGEDMRMLLRRLEDLLSQHFPQTQAPGGTVTFVSATELQGALQGLEERLLLRVQETLAPKTGLSRGTGGAPQMTPQDDDPALVAPWLPADAMVYVLVAESAVLLFFAAGMLWRWYRSRT